MTLTRKRALRELALAWGVQTSYVDVLKQRQWAEPDGLLGVLQALGAPVASPADIPAALRQRRQDLWRRVVEPVMVAWDGRLGAVRLRLPSPDADGRIRFRIAPQEEAWASAEPRAWTAEGAFDAVDVLGHAEVEGVSHVELGVRGAPVGDASGRLPYGYHRLVVEAGAAVAASLVVSAPRRADARPGSDRASGVFLPLYALHSHRSWGVGDLTDLDALREWARSLGATVVATLPLLAAFLDEPFEPSPYSPASRLFWNELFIDVLRIPELERSPEGRALVESSAMQRELAAIRTAPLVDYRRAMAAKRRVLEELARCFYAAPSPRTRALEKFTRDNPRLEDYAGFRAAVERHHAPWTEWPRQERDGALPERPTLADTEVRRYHAYVQWVAHEQLTEVVRRGREGGAGLYFDMPLGVNAAGYDVWRERDAFATGVTAGAPPDTFFAKGQDWGFRPQHPERIREQGYRYHIACLRHLLQHATVLRIDHVMGYHRLFWIPDGMEARRGVYVRQRPDELYAVLMLESTRTGTTVIGEDLGLVQATVRRALGSHRLLRTFVVQYELGEEPDRLSRPAPVDAMAAMNTHDMPPFASFWRGSDLQLRLEEGHIDARRARQLATERGAVRRALVHSLAAAGWLEGENAGALAEASEDLEIARILRACLAYLSAGPDRLTMVSLEDLWLERQPQNVPASTDEHPNWRRRARFAFEEMRSLPGVVDTLREVDRLRRAGEGE